MKITVKMIGPFSITAGFSEKEIEIPERSTGNDLLIRIAFDKERPKIVTRNGRAIAPDEILTDGDRIVISPLYSGG